MSQHWFRTLALTLLLALLVAVPIGIAGQSSPPTEIDQAAGYRGEATFRTYCSSCHGKGALGDGPLAQDLKVQPANLTELATRNAGDFPYAMVLTTIENGRSVRGHGTEDMPAWGDAFEMTSQSEAEAKAKMSDLAHYLWSLQAAE